MPRLAVRNFPYGLRTGAGSASNAAITGLSTAAISFGAWFKIDKTQPSSFPHLMSIGGGDSACFFLSPSTGAVQAKFNNIGGSATGTNFFTTGYVGWVHLAVTYDGANITRYVNGVQSGSPTARTGAITYTNATYYVGNDSAANLFRGVVDEPFIYARGLTAAEVADIYFQGLYSSTGLISLHRFAEGSGTSAADSSGTGNTLTLSSATWSSDVPMISRTAAPNRLAVRDMKAGLNFAGGGTSHGVVTTNAIGATNDASMAFWVKRTGLMATGVSRLMTWGNDTFAVTVGSAAGSGSVPAGIIGSSNGGHSTTGIPLPLGIWKHIVVTKTGTLWSLFVDGVLADTNTVTASASGVIRIGTNQAGSEGLVGLMARAFAWTVCLTAAQVSDLYWKGVASGTGLVGQWLLSEGAGTTANDSSGSANHGTITGATYTADTPMKARQVVGGNLVKNGDFEYQPPYTAASNISNRWIDGTAAGSTTNKIFDWHFSVSGTGTARFDTNDKNSGVGSLKASLSAVASYIELRNGGVGTSYDTAPGLGFDLLPSTSYTLRYYMKMANVTGDATNGARIVVAEANGAGTNVATTGPAYVKTNTGWTLYTHTFTTNAATRRAHIEAIFYGHQGTATLQGDVWFDDIQLRKTTPDARIAV